MIDELDLLRSLRPDVPPPSEEVRDHAQAALARAIGTGSRHPRRRWIVRLALATVVAVAALLLVDALDGGSGGPTTAAAAALERLAHVAALQAPSSTPGPGQYLYVDSENAYASDTYGAQSYTAIIPQHRQIWIGADRSGLLRETDGQPSFPTDADRSAWVAAGSPSLGTGTSDTTFGAGCLSIGPTDLAALPTDPATLGAELSARQIEGGPPGSAEDFVQVGDLLRETDASPALRAAIFEVAERIPGVELLGTVTDHAGRTGVGLGRVANGVRAELIFDPATSALLAEQDVRVSSGAIVDWAVYLRSQIVDALPAGVSTKDAARCPAAGGSAPAATS